MRTRRLPLCAGLLMLAGAFSVASQEVKTARSLGVEFLLGGDQWQPGQRYRAGSDWLAMVCVKSECRLEPARLAVRAENWQGHYDDQPSSGQKLSFRRQQSGPGLVLAWFHLDPTLTWLTPGPVTTYAATTAKKKRPASEGTLELAVDLPEGRQATLVPLYDREGRRFLLQLRAPGKRQLLDQLGACSGRVGSDFLVWAGDLDRDGKPDFLIDFVDADGEGKLYLGKEARPDEIAGVAGVYVPPPFGGECDGGGWLE